jgi:hypothetical protein
MAKMTKAMLKGIVKECLVEILSEGLGGAGAIVETQSRSSSKPTQHTPKHPAPPAKKSIFDQLDTAFAAQQRQTKTSDKFEARISEAAQIATTDPILQSILVETAQTTLQDQMRHEQQIPSVANFPAQDAPPSFSVGPGSAGLNIDQLFGDAVSNWGEVMQRADKK